MSLLNILFACHMAHIHNLFQSGCNRCKIGRTLKMARVVSEREAVKIGLETIHFYLQREGDGMELGAASSGNIFQTRLLGGVGSSFLMMLCI